MLRKRLLLPLSVTLSGLIAVFLISAYYYHSDRQRAVVQDMFREARALFDLEIEQNVAALAAVMAALDRNVELAEAFLAEDRGRLLALSRPVFERLHANLDVTHFYYHTVDNINYLRVHQPERYGDRIDRVTLKEAVARQSVFAGLELGPIGTFTLRVVAPWRRDGAVIGYLELGREIDGMVSTVGRLHQAHLLMLISKAAIDRPRWEGAMAFLGRQASWDDLEQHAMISEAPSEFGGEVGFLETITDGGEARIKDRYFRVFKTPISDAAGQSVAKLAMVMDVTAWHAALHRYGAVILLAAVALGGGLLALFFRLGTGVEASFRKYEQTLRGERDRVRRQAVSLARFADQLATANEQAELARQAAEEASRSRSRFLSAISHELHTPLNAVIGFSELLESELNGMSAGERLSGYAGYIVTSGRQLLGTVDDLITYAEGEGNEVQRQATRFDVGELIREACLRVELHAQDRAVTVEEVMTPGRLIAWGDPVSFQQGMYRLLAHAIDVTPAGGRVRVGASGWEDGPVEITVEDQGQGLSEERIRSLLRPFENIDSEHHGGLELTLALVYRLITSYGGIMSIDVVAEGGARVRLVLPAPPAGPGGDGGIPADRVAAAAPAASSIGP